MRRRARGTHPSAWNADPALQGAPHCDQRVLHAPDECEYCDAYPEWQEARRMWGINFTGHDDADKLACPADLARPAGEPGDHRQWGGNRSTTASNGRSYEAELDKQLREIAEQRNR